MTVRKTRERRRILIRHGPLVKGRAECVDVGEMMPEFDRMMMLLTTLEKPKRKEYLKQLGLEFKDSDNDVPQEAKANAEIVLGRLRDRLRGIAQDPLYAMLWDLLSRLCTR